MFRRTSLVLVVTLFASVARAQEAPLPYISAIQSPACATPVDLANAAAALASGCARLQWDTSIRETKPDDARETKLRAWRALSAIYSASQTLGRGHYAARPLTAAELAALKKLAPTSFDVGVSGSGNGTWTGAGSKDTETFSMASREWRVRWSATATSSVGGLVSITVYSADGTSVSSIRSGDIQGSAGDVSYVRAPAGRFYLSINAANVIWRVSVEP